MRPGSTRSGLARPKVICHLVSSIDGRLLADRWMPAELDAHTRTVSMRCEQLAAKLAVDGFIVGSRSLEALPSVMAGKAKSGARRPPTPHVGARRGRKLAVVIDLDGTLHYGQDDAEGHHIVAVLGEQVPETYLAELRQVGVSYLFASGDGHDLEDALARLGEDFDVDTLLLEGGGRLNSAFMNAGLIDEISLLVCPVIDDQPGGLNTWEYAGSMDERVAATRVLRHVNTETLGGDVVWLRYHVDADEAQDYDLADFTRPVHAGCNYLLC